MSHEVHIDYNTNVNKVTFKQMEDVKMRKKTLSLLLASAIVIVIIASVAISSVAADAGMYIPGICIKNVTADSSAGDDYKPWFAFDSNEGSFWHTPWDLDYTEPNEALPFPHWIMAELEEAVTVDSVVYVPRAGQPLQQVTEYEVWISPDNNSDNLKMVDSGVWEWNGESSQTSSFTPQKAVLVRFVIKDTADESATNTCASAAEIRIHSPNVIDVPALVSYDEIKEVSANSSQPGYGPELAINDNPADFWHTPWEVEIPSYPHWIMVEFDEVRTIDMLIYTPRAGVWEQFVTEYEVWISPDENPYNLVKVDDGSWEYGPFARSTFDATEAKLVKLVIKGRYDGETDGVTSAVAEIDFRTTDREQMVQEYVENSDIKSVSASSYQPGYEPELAFNNNVSDFWHTPWGEDAQPYPHWIMAEFSTPQTIDSLVYIPRSGVPGQFATEYEVWISSDNNPENLVMADSGTWEVGSSATSEFEPVTATLVKFVIKARADGDTTDMCVSVAELKFGIAEKNEEVLSPDEKTGYSFFYQERAGKETGTVELRILCVIDAETLAARDDCDITVSITAGQSKSCTLSFDTVYRRVTAGDEVYSAANGSYIFGVIIVGVPDSYDGDVSAWWANGV